MTGGDLVKLRDAGFRIFSQDIIDLKITESFFGVRKIYGKYKTKAELARAWDALMENPKHISR